VTSNTYEGLHARYYDFVYADKPYGDEARFVDALLQEAGVERGSLLDVACGTGRHAAAFGSLGWEVTGIDYSETLLEHARLNAPEARLFRQDMRELDVPGGPFDAVTCLFDSIGYPLDDEGVLAALASMGRHTAAAGAVAIEFLHAPALLRHASPIGVRTVQLWDESGELVRISRTSLDRGRYVMEVEFELIELRADGTYERWREVQANRFFSVDDMRALLGRANLNAERFVPAYQPDDGIDDRTFHVIALARRLD
jgi:SAM-dependent methyltransferase